MARNYINRAGTDYEYFDLGPEWKAQTDSFGLTDHDMFELYNIRFLDEAIAEGKSFKFSHDPRTDDRTLKDEYTYLIGNGYIYDPTTKTAIPGR